MLIEATCCLPSFVSAAMTSRRRSICALSAGVLALAVAASSFVFAVAQSLAITALRASLSGWTTSRLTVTAGAAPPFWAKASGAGAATASMRAAIAVAPGKRNFIPRVSLILVPEYLREGASDNGLHCNLNV